jgi:predicted enzyme related to lactoylglutathione lyase
VTPTRSLRPDSIKNALTSSSSFPFSWTCTERFDLDLNAAIQAAAQRGATIITAPCAAGSLRIAAITDPAGNVIGIWTG